MAKALEGCSARSLTLLGHEIHKGPAAIGLVVHASMLALGQCVELPFVHHRSSLTGAPRVQDVKSLVVPLVKSDGKSAGGLTGGLTGGLCQPKPKNVSQACMPRYRHRKATPRKELWLSALKGRVKDKSIYTHRLLRGRWK